MSRTDENELHYVASLAGVQFEEDSRGNFSWIHVLPVGVKYEHPKYGTIDLTPQRIKNFADNVNSNVRGIALDIDYDHKSKTDKAAGWIVSADARDSGLWVKASWTKEGRRVVEEDEYRYLSADYLDEWKHPGTGASFRDVLCGAGLTNRPFIKEIQPINLSEFPDEDSAYSQALRAEEIRLGLYEEGIELRDIPKSERDKHPDSDFAGKNRSFPIFIPEDVGDAASSLGRAGSDNYSTDELKKRIIAIAKRKGPRFVAALPDSWKEGNKLAEENEGFRLSEEAVRRLSEMLGIEGDPSEDGVLEKVGALHKFHQDAKADDDKAKKFAEDFPEEARRLEEAEKSLRDAEQSRRLSETNEKIATWGSKGLPPAVNDEIRNLRIALDDERATKFDEVITKVVETGLVEFDEKGGSGGSEEQDKQKAIDEAIQKVLSENDGMTYRDALTRVLSENPNLFSDYAVPGQ